MDRVLAQASCFTEVVNWKLEKAGLVGRIFTVSIPHPRIGCLVSFNHKQTKDSPGGTFSPLEKALQLPGFLKKKVDFSSQELNMKGEKEMDRSERKCIKTNAQCILHPL